MRDIFCFDPGKRRALFAAALAGGALVLWLAAASLKAGSKGEGPPPAPTDAAATLHERWADFTALSPEKQKEMRELHQALAGTEEDAQALRATFDRYLLWRDTLTNRQRARIDDAASTEARLAAVETVIEEQRRRLENDLEPLRASPAGTRLALFNDMSRPMILKRAQELEAAIEPKLSTAERGWLEGQKQRDRLIGAVLLAGRHDVSPPEPLAFLAQRLYAAIFERIQRDLRGFSADRYEALPPDEQARFRRLLGAVAPTVHKDRLAAYLDAVDYQVVGELRSVETISGALVWVLVGLYYFAEHPEKQPPEFREQFGAYLKPGPPRPRPNFPPHDRARRRGRSSLLPKLKRDLDGP